MQILLARLLGFRTRKPQAASGVDAPFELIAEVRGPTAESTLSCGTTERAFFDGSVMIW